MIWNNAKQKAMSVDGFIDSLGRFGELFVYQLGLANYPRDIGSYDSPKMAELSWQLVPEDFPPDELSVITKLRDSYVAKGLREDDAQVVAYIQIYESVPAEVCDEMSKRILDYTGPRASKYDGDKLPPSLSFLYVTQGVAC